jgi:hypothetical protein
MVVYGLRAKISTANTTVGRGANTRSHNKQRTGKYGPYRTSLVGFSMREILV